MTKLQHDFAASVAGFDSTEEYVADFFGVGVCSTVP